jgi:hypothetical protein
MYNNLEGYGMSIKIGSLDDLFGWKVNKCIVSYNI